MKSNIIKRFAGVLAFLMLATQISIPVYATTGACSGHDGVNCSAGADSDGSVICNDGWTDSSVDYVGMEDDCGVDYVAPTPMLINEPEAISGSGQEEEPPMETAEEDEEDVVLSEPVDEDNVVDVVEVDLEGASEAGGESLVDQAVDDVLAGLEGESTDDVATAIEQVGNTINTRITVLEKELAAIPVLSSGGYGKNAALHMMLQKKIRHLHDLRNKLRAKALKKYGNLAQKIVRIKNMPAIYEVRWGNLDSHRQPCRLVSTTELKNALSTGDVPTSCEPNRYEYKGKITVDVGQLKVKKEVLFEKNDKVTVTSGQSIEFSSMIAGHWDGLAVEYVPPASDTKKAVSITVSIGDLKKTYSGAEILGRKKIGNGQFIEFKHLGKVLSGVNKVNQDKLIQNKVTMEEKISNLRAKLDRLRLMKTVGTGANELEAIVDEAGEYNFDDATAAEVANEIQTVVNELNDDSKPADIAAKAARLKEKLKVAKAKTKSLKFKQNLIPFKDTDDDQWYTDYVSAVKNRGIISGYKDAAGNELGEFRPSNNITVAEILKIALETAGKGTAVGFPTLEAAKNHWAKGYVKKGEELGLDLVKGTVNLNRNATRGEVIRLMLEALGIKPDNITKTNFSDLPLTHKHAKFIEYAKSLGIVSGDAGKTTFRPDVPVNRAEAAKIADQINKIIIGGWDS
ncbi:S-layer homology domain-containing protein [Patescibacteria group bacterium]|nr:S-layer homology domain-containing protein [Patescibacteria group bacterium]